MLQAPTNTLELPMPPKDTRPANSYIARALPVPGHEGLFYAQFAAPGMFVDLVYEDAEGQRPSVYKTDTAAIHMAMVTLLKTLNARGRNQEGNRRTGKQLRHHRMSSAEFAVKLAEADVPPSEFSDLWGTSTDRVFEWMESQQDVPFPLWWVLELLRLPGALEIARKITAEHIEFREKTAEYHRQHGGPTGPIRSRIKDRPKSDS